MKSHRAASVRTYLVRRILTGSLKEQLGASRAELAQVANTVPHYHLTRMGQDARQELIGCHDCGEAVSFSAGNCPHCGSTQPCGPYVLSVGELKRHRIEEKNDRRLVAVTALCCVLGVAFGVLTASGPWSAIMGGLGFGFVGLAVGAPAAFIINVGRMLG